MKSKKPLPEPQESSVQGVSTFLQQLLLITKTRRTVASS